MRECIHHRHVSDFRPRETACACFDHQHLSEFGPREAACAVLALESAQHLYGKLQGLPHGALQAIGGLPAETAAELEEFLQQLAEEGTPNPTVPQVMAELDAHDRIGYSMDQ